MPADPGERLLDRRRFLAGMTALGAGAGVAADCTIEGGAVRDLRGLDWRQWMLWLRKRG